MLHIRKTQICDASHLVWLLFFNKQGKITLPFPPTLLSAEMLKDIFRSVGPKVFILFSSRFIWVPVRSNYSAWVNQHLIFSDTAKIVTIKLAWTRDLAERRELRQLPPCLCTPDLPGTTTHSPWDFWVPAALGKLPVAMDYQTATAQAMTPLPQPAVLLQGNCVVLDNLALNHLAISFRWRKPCCLARAYGLSAKSHLMLHSHGLWWEGCLDDALNPCRLLSRVTYGFWMKSYDEKGLSWWQAVFEAGRWTSSLLCSQQPNTSLLCSQCWIFTFASYLD